MIELYNAFIDFIVPPWINLVNFELDLFDVAGSGGATDMFQDYVNSNGGSAGFHDRRGDIAGMADGLHL
ncbi:hypothetical protein [Corynebacterium nuruki]|jgi:hypothetical protein|uniref:hypothetical protein n=1 Tax=Corynebacterium nuruki TaxID=1032851 RepID=UPI0002487E76|nr:hypothetical protein [Corynebacterium nuruki]